ncbi:MAG: trans-2-enoyl-CoA reductase family protein [Ewingella americana]|jgi:enoyl-[acyl-carrier protein] reductase/trans-2-enoyl-CoA reductase (NAD+)|uniref:Enoyl-[acyl-carrier-protein] reductase [NADH] n=2 Tax=Ewingella americana TaxID=41202 RepID=A0A085GB46_EWIA3|nr:enoyl-ACP reductase FabV [Ewingella americana]KAA8730309.1 trans-2-enoyl-CoA reductase family protein [Ewingella americana]KFC80941.1 short-chain alcohol dehydrogenase family [Ewingella americana ATCC 33852]MCI1678856.1 trans-2-enoyl-CoA reductase family protein [Ewingella americana]MCI1852500.1 trans-2-enoyl-CoA reductase family protein [Ewingella americana]MCI1864209.1 trans-2-enoyl-CoA reductase family protein [Ewingella americana]
MIIKPKIRGFICTTTHPVGCEANVREQIAYVKAQGKLKDGPKRVLVIGASTGYGLASRINAAFGSDAATIGVFFEKPGSEAKTGSAGWYNAAAFDKAAKEEGLYSKSVNGDAFSNECRDTVIKLIKEDLGQIDLVVYSLASPVRKMPESGELVRSALKPIGEPYQSTALDTNKDKLVSAVVEPANEQEIADTIKVMGGQDWELWINALADAGVLADNAKSVAYSYIGTELTWPIYWHGTLGKAKEDLDRAAHAIDTKLKAKGGSANVAVLKSVVTQASAAIPVMPLYISIVFKIMKEQGIHEGCIEQIQRLFATKMYNDQTPSTDDKNRLRLDDWELRDEVQKTCGEIWKQLNDDNIYQLTDYQSYKEEFLRLFGFGLKGVDYDADVSGEVNFDVIELV